MKRNVGKERESKGRRVVESCRKRGTDGDVAGKIEVCSIGNCYRGQNKGVDK